MSHVRWGLLVFLSPVMVWLTLLILLPQVDMFIMAIRAENELGEMGFSLGNFKLFFMEPIYWRTFARTASFSVLVTFLTFLITMPVAFYITKVVTPKFQGFLAVLVLMPFWVSELVRV